MANEKFTDAGKKALAEVLHHFQAAQAAFSKLSAVENHICLDKHNEGASLNHCVRWGLQAVEDLAEDLRLK